MQIGLCSKLIITLIGCVLLFGCGGQQVNETVAEQQNAPPEVDKLARSYKNICVYKFKASPEIESEYNQQINDMQNSMVERLKTKQQFEQVEVSNQNQETDSDSLIVKTNITYFDIVGFWKRGFSPWARSWIELDLQLIDSNTEEILRDEKMSSANNPMAAYFGWGGTDRSLPSDMGKTLAEYITLSMP